MRWHRKRQRLLFAAAELISTELRAADLFLERHILAPLKLKALLDLLPLAAELGLLLCALIRRRFERLVLLLRVLHCTGKFLDRVQHLGMTLLSCRVKLDDSPASVADNGWV